MRILRVFLTGLILLLGLTPSAHAATLIRTIAQPILALPSVSEKSCPAELLSQGGAHLCGAYEHGGVAFAQLWDESTSPEKILPVTGVSGWRQYPDDSLLRVYQLQDDAYFFVEVDRLGEFILSLYDRF